MLLPVLLGAHAAPGKCHDAVRALLLIASFSGEDDQQTSKALDSTYVYTPTRD